MIPIKKSSGYFESFDGTKIYYEVRGQGKPLLFVYGIACLINHWHPQIHHFSQHYQTIAFDFRGHHFSDTPLDKKSLTVDALAKDILALCDHLQVERVFALGHSFGTEVLLQAYFQRPEMFHGTCLISGFFSNPFSNLVSTEHLREAFIYLKRLYNSAPSMVNTAWKYGVTNPVSMLLSSVVGGFNLEKTALKDIEIYAQGVSNIDVRVFLTLFEELIRYDGMEDLRDLKAPSLVIAGEKDALTPTYVQQQIKNLIPQGELELIPEGSHCVQLDFPLEVNAKIESFLKTLAY